MAELALGIDLAWSDGKTSGMCALKRTSGQWEVVESVAEPWPNCKIVDWTLDHAGRTTVVAIDAPLWIPNETGVRSCDRTVASKYAKYLIGVHSCNRRRFADFPRNEAIREELMDRGGFVEAPERGSRVFFETYPHPAIVNVLRLSKRVPYKKGRVAKRRRRLRWLAEMLLAELPIASPTVAKSNPLDEVLRPDFDGLRGKALKAAEDRIDGLVCAYCAASWIETGCARNERIGKPGLGMMIFPKRRP